MAQPDFPPKDDPQDTIDDCHFDRFQFRKLCFWENPWNWLKILSGLIIPIASVNVLICKDKKKQQYDLVKANESNLINENENIDYNVLRRKKWL